MDCGYYNSFVFGWYCVGILTGIVAHSTCTRYFRKPRQLAMYLPTKYHINAGYDPDEDPNEIMGDDEIEEDEIDEDEIVEVDNAGSYPVFNVGDRVRVKLSPNMSSPSFGWGGVNPDETGVILSENKEYFKDKLCYRVNFPTQKAWLALSSELEKI
jgi:hypothetical protein